ncbi:MAG: serine hydrolase [Betaproteobacteria bacterium]|nr:serine hydrolase [Betaproteobacteria bacterium]
MTIHYRSVLLPGAIVLALLLVLAAIALQLTGHGYFWKALRYTYLQGYTTAHIDDARNFEQAEVQAGAPAPWMVRDSGQRVSTPTASLLASQKASAFLVAHQGALVYEEYFAPYSAESRTNVFSVTKTVTTMLLGRAVQEGLIGSAQEPLGRWVDRYAQDPVGQKATLLQLSGMTSGHAWNENYYLPLNETTELYFGGNAAGTVLRMGFEAEPGSRYEYSSGSTQVLGVALKNILAEKLPGITLSDYLSTRLWQPLGMEGGASWSLDRPRAEGGMEMTYCCLNATARQLARLGQLLLQKGSWQGQQLLAESFVETMIQSNGHVLFYGHGVWRDPDNRPGYYFMQGHLGQYVIVVPEAQLVIVKMGTRRDRAFARHPGALEEVRQYVAEGLRLAGL